MPGVGGDVSITERKGDRESMKDENSPTHLSSTHHQMSPQQAAVIAGFRKKHHPVTRANKRKQTTNKKRALQDQDDLEKPIISPLPITDSGENGENSVEESQKLDREHQENKTIGQKGTGKAKRKSGSVNKSDDHKRRRKLDEECRESELETDKDEEMEENEVQKKKNTDIEQQEGECGNENDQDGDDSTGKSRKLEENEMATLDSSVDNCRVHPPKLFGSTNEILDLKCVWLGCQYNDTNLTTFMYHVRLHVPHLKIRTRSGGDEVYYCQWHRCDFETEDMNKIITHVMYHTYHSKLKCLGNNVASHIQLPTCKNNTGTLHNTPKLPTRFICCWENCDCSYNDPQMFFSHTECHVKHQPSGGKVSCGWRNCIASFRTNLKLAKHVKTHTEEKTLACPNCGSVFDSNKEFIYHCISWTPVEVNNFKCARCRRCYLTAEQLQQHTQKHFSSYRCSSCVEVYATASALAVHIRRKHLESRVTMQHVDKPTCLCSVQACTFFAEEVKVEETK